MSGKDILSPTPRRLSCVEAQQNVLRVLVALRGPGLARKALRFHAYGCWTRRGIRGAELSNFLCFDLNVEARRPDRSLMELIARVLAHSTWASREGEIKKIYRPDYLKRSCPTP